MDNRQYNLAERQALLMQVDNIERHKLHEVITTSEMRRWCKRFGPSPEEMRRQLEGKQPGRSADGNGKPRTT